MLPILVLNHSFPHEMFYKTTTNFNGLKVFGSLFYASTLSTNKRKFDQRVSKCVLLVLKGGQKDMFC